MKIRNILSAAAITLLSLSASAATIVVPAAGTGPGAFESQWQSELTLHNAAPRVAEVTVAFHKGTEVLGPIDVTLQPRSTVSIADIAKEEFGLTSANGALVIEASERDARSLVVTSRTFNTSATGEFGQDIAATRIESAAVAGEIAALPGPAALDGSRFNFGLYSVTASKVTWELVRADGTVDATKSVDYAAGEHAQYTFGINSLLGRDPAANDTVYARVAEGKVIAYGSVINATGDPSFVPGVRTRDDIQILFAGLDLNRDGQIEMSDADGNGVIDTPLTLYTSLYPMSFNIVAEGEFGEAVTLELISSPAYAVLQGEGLQVAPSGDLKGQTGEIKLRATSGNTSTILTIPVLFK
jgi:hypothetical protein